jgi:tellurite resistance protein TerC
MADQTPFIFWFCFNATVLTLLTVDLFLFHRHPRPLSTRDAALMSAFWIGLSLAFNALIWRWKGPQPGLEFLTGYLVEYSLSVDNIFVFVMIFRYFRVPREYQHRVLFWGIIGALVMRGLMIWLGVSLVNTFHWMLYVFGAFLIYTGIKLAFDKNEGIDPEHNPFVRLCSRIFPIARSFHGAKFSIREQGRFALTPLAIVLVMVETTDLLFALDSIPAIIAITKDPFIIYTSNVCAILGLRSLYFVLASVVHKFVFLNYGLSAVLAFIGVKMVIADFYKIPTGTSLAVVGVCLATSVLASLLHNRRISK